MYVTACLLEPPAKRHAQRAMFRWCSGCFAPGGWFGHTTSGERGPMRFSMPGAIPWRISATRVLASPAFTTPER